MVKEKHIYTNSQTRATHLVIELASLGASFSGWLWQFWRAAVITLSSLQYLAIWRCRCPLLEHSQTKNQSFDWQYTGYTYAVLSDTTNQIFTFHQNSNFLIYLLTLHPIWANEVTMTSSSWTRLLIFKVFAKLLINFYLQWVKSYDDKLRKQTLHEQGFGAKAIVAKYPRKGWKLRHC